MRKPTSFWNALLERPGFRRSKRSKQRGLVAARTLRCEALESRELLSVYYVDATHGNNSWNGLAGAYTAGTTGPWKTIAKVNSAPLHAGDIVLFARGELWREKLVPKSGSASGVVTYGAYGTGAKPLLMGSIEEDSTTNWTNVGTNLWSTTAQFSYDVGNIIFNNSTCGRKRWVLADSTSSPDSYHTGLHNQGDFYYDTNSSHKVIVYSTSNPASYYSDIELALNRRIVDEGGQSYVTYQNLALEYGGAHGIGGANTAYITVSNCDISFIGGSLLGYDSYGNPVRFGNGIEFWANAHDNVVVGCKIWEVYDTGVTNQGNSGSQYNITYYNNIIWNCELSYEFFLYTTDGAASASNIHFENNTCLDAGYGWSHVQRPNPYAHHVIFWSTASSTGATFNNFYIRNNIFDTSDYCDIEIRWQTSYLAALTLDYNLYYQSPGLRNYLKS
jgi:hypothetical protein